MPENYQRTLQTPFDRAVIQVVDYMYKNWEIFKKFRHKYELLNQLKLKNNNWTKYKNGERSIPETIRPHIIDVLVNEYGVSASYLRTGSGNMFTNNLLLEEEDIPLMISPPEAKKLRDRIAQLEEENKRLHRVVGTQDKLIKQLEERLNK
jgi:hypothetical protein